MPGPVAASELGVAAVRHCVLHPWQGLASGAVGGVRCVFLFLTRTQLA